MNRHVKQVERAHGVGSARKPIPRFRYQSSGIERSNQAPSVRVSRQTLKLYTIRDWTVKRGHDKEFVAAWKNFANWIVLQKGTGPTSLFKDDLDPAHYISIESWEDESTRAMIQKGVPFGRQSYKLQQLTIDFSSRSFKKEGEEFRLPQTAETSPDPATRESD